MELFSRSVSNGFYIWVCDDWLNVAKKLASLEAITVRLCISLRWYLLAIDFDLGLLLPRDGTDFFSLVYRFR
jgi:hypothetical protein